MRAVKPTISLLALLSTIACRGDVTAADPREAQEYDHTLKAQVLQAAGDSVPLIDSAVETDIAARTVTENPIEPEPVPVSAEVVVPTMAPVVVKTVPVPQKAVGSQQIARLPEPRPSTPTEPAKSISSVVRSPTRATASAGTTLSLAAGERICVNTNRVGDRFSARVSASVSGANGTVIPRGASATGVVTSLTGPLGEEHIEIAIRSVTVGGTTHRISSRVTNIQLDRTPGADRCIPDNGNITVRLTEPLSITRSE